MKTAILTITVLMVANFCLGSLLFAQNDNGKRSAVVWADKINTPILLMHGGADRSVDPIQTLNLAQLLQKLKKNYELMIYNGDTHTLNKNQKDRDARAIAWFKKYIK